MKESVRTTRGSEYAPKVPAGPAVLLTMILVAGSAAADSTPQAADSPPAPTSQDAPAAAGATLPDPKAAADMDYEEGWTVDEATGLYFKIAKIPKVEGTYRWMDDKTVRFRHGVYFEVVDHDEDWFWVKAWKSILKQPPRRGRTEEEMAVEIERVAASYQTDVATVDRLAFQDFGDGLPRSGQWRNGFDVADMNGDGHLDIVSGPARKSLRPRPNIFLGDSRGHWRLWSEARYPVMPYDYGDAAAGDLNGDGHMDLVLGVHLRGLLALAGDGQGGFSPWNTGIGLDRTGKAASFSSRAVELVDWNGDGRLDILALGEGPKGAGRSAASDIPSEIINNSRGFLVYVNQGDGTWSPQRPGGKSPLSYDFGDDFVLADFNRDGITDVALASRTMASTSILGIGAEEGLLQARTLERLRPRSLIGAVTAADRDGDGAVELYVGYQSQDIDGVFRTGIDIFSPRSSPDGELDWERLPLIASRGMRGIFAIDAGDLDGDGRLDLAAITGDGETWVFLGDGEGGLVREESPELPPPAKGCRGYALRLVDLDRDGRSEVIAGFSGEQAGLSSGMPELHEPGCPDKGSLRAWKTVPAAGGAPPAAAGSAR